MSLSKRYIFSGFIAIFIFSPRFAEQSGDTLTIPHIDMHNREFVLLPLSEIAPYKLHPVLKKTAVELLTKLKMES